MPQFTGRLRTPRLSAAPSSPVTGEMYYDTGTNTLYWWNGTAWISASGGAFTVPSIADGEFAVWDAGTSAWVRSSFEQVIKIPAAGLSFPFSNAMIFAAGDADILTDGGFTAYQGLWARSQTLAEIIFGTWKQGDTNDRFDILGDGMHRWGPGNGALDVNLYRIAADLLKTDDGFQVTAGLWAAWTGSEWAFDVATSGVLTLRGSPRIIFAPDVVLYRLGADVLYSDDVIGSAAGMY